MFNPLTGNKPSFSFSFSFTVETRGLGENFKHVAWGMAGGVCGQVGGNAASQGCYIDRMGGVHRHSR